MNEKMMEYGSRLPVAERLNDIEEYYFSTKLREIDRMNQEGTPVVNLGIGSPDQPPHPSVIKTLYEEALKPGVHGYQSYKGHPALRRAAAEWYERSYGVTLDPETEILPLVGSKEGVMHLCMTYINEGDEVWIPNPGYPTYRTAATVAGALVKSYPLSEENDWFPDFELLESMHPDDVKIMFVNYPHMPTGKAATKEMFTKLVAFAKKHQILLVHDNPYSFILNKQPMSLLSIPGAKEVAVELNSLSKSHNMAGWRIGFLSGQAQRIQEVMRFKSQMDSGMFLPLQLAAVQALSLDDDWYKELNELYKSRRTKVYELLDYLQCTYDKNQSGLFVWARIPETFSTGYDLSDQVLSQSRVFLTPGGIFGDAGNKYIRVSLCANHEKLDEAIRRISN